MEICLGEKKISNLKFANDTTLITSTEIKLIQLLDRLEETSTLYDFGINYRTKIMIVEHEIQNHMNL